MMVEISVYRFSNIVGLFEFLTVIIYVRESWQSFITKLISHIATTTSLCFRVYEPSCWQRARRKRALERRQKGQIILSLSLFSRVFSPSSLFTNRNESLFLLVDHIYTCLNLLGKIAGRHIDKLQAGVTGKVKSSE